jgi:hypothetical protein
MEDIKPNYYQIKVKGIAIDVFDIARAWNMPNTLFSAFKYFRTKGDKDKKINDLEKAIECIQREINYLKEESILKDFAKEKRFVPDISFRNLTKA